ncbi:hypothetical protein Belba_3023 [Belliella baltica DSM 15883]|uniref:SPOR domain-containing protein n=1 Tax=Belliella baltica (strain DSM 15883 / CIP 108006 / LMG 21964 / BA134) TaxID=866536 RepID=I3Z8H2_BELBD|nr:hypothetical protein [Belliella baltica]AFL85540.1 hypothetical protein Belba_3023 [Belliella baltica DSM 15883]
MADRKNSKNNDFKEDQEYGFPFVEVVPLAFNSESLTEEFPKEEIEESETSAIAAEEQTIDTTEDIKSEVAPEIEPVVIETLKTESVEIKPIEIKKAERTFQTANKKKSSGPLILILTLLILVVLGAMAYFLYYLPEVENGQQTANVEVQEETTNLQSESAIETNELPIDADETETEIEEEVIQEASEPVVDQSSPELTLIQSRDTNPRYFIVVASVISERLARSEAEKFMGMDKNTWIIFPYGDIRNYRIAVGKFDNIESATEAWEEAKGEFGDAIWILKY